MTHFLLFGLEKIRKISQKRKLRSVTRKLENTNRAFWFPRLLIGHRWQRTLSSPLRSWSGRVDSTAWSEKCGITESNWCRARAFGSVIGNARWGTKATRPWIARQHRTDVGGCQNESL